MSRTERWMIASIIAICLSICLLCFTALMMHEPPCKRLIHGELVPCEGNQ